MRENDEYSASKVALFMTEKQTVPAARKTMYGMPPTSGRNEPRPKPRPSM